MGGGGRTQAHLTLVALHAPAVPAVLVIPQGCGLLRPSANEAFISADL